MDPGRHLRYPCSAEALQLKIDTSTSFQVIDGFGASDAWQCAFIGKNWPQEKREHIADLLFSREVDTKGNPKGIGLSLWRFNIGAGTAEQGDASDIRNPWRRTECFQAPDGSYDWSKQAGQQWFLRAARHRGVERFLAFPNSAPVHLTRNGKGYAPKSQPYPNVKPGKLGDYAIFLAEVPRALPERKPSFRLLESIQRATMGMGRCWSGRHAGAEHRTPGAGPLPF